MATQKEKKKMLTKNKILEIYTFSIEQYKENMKSDGRSKSPVWLSDYMMKEWDNAIVEDDMVTGYYRNGYGVMNMPPFPKWA